MRKPSTANTTFTTKLFPGLSAALFASAALVAMTTGGCTMESGGDAAEESADTSEDAITTVTFTGPGTAAPSTCAGPFTITRSSTRQRTLTLSGQGAGKFYLSSSCAGSSFTTQTMAAGVQTLRFYFKDATPQTLTLKAIVGSGSATRTLVVGAGSGADAGTDSGTDSGTGSDAGSGSSARVRAMWTSDAGNAVSAAARGSSVRTAFFAQLSAKQINRVIVEARGLLKSNRAALKDFVEDCKGRGIDVELMVNAKRSGYTVLTSATELAPYAGYAKAYQDSYCPTGTEAACASAFNVDYEPHIFPEWDTARAQAEVDYLAGLRQVKAALTGSRLLLAAAVTNWYDGSAYDTGGQSFAKAILNAGVDRYYIMNYTDTTAQMVSRASGEVAIACAIPGKEVISISDAKDEGTTTADKALTFREEGWGAMNAAWTAMNAQLGSQPCFKGNAGFDYDDMIALAP